MNDVTTMSSRPRGIRLGPRTRKAVRAAARFVNPVVLFVAGRRWMPVVGVLRHRGRRSFRTYETPLGMRPMGDAFVMPLTFSEHAGWYRNVIAAGWCEVRYMGSTHTVFCPEVIDFTAASAAFPRYERLQFRLIGIDEFLHLRRTPEGWSQSTPAAPRPAAGA
jgi:deazaflavin-dependent oxidoreductase (nitroreductase family)